MLPEKHFNVIANRCPTCLGVADLNPRGEPEEDDSLTVAKTHAIGIRFEGVERAQRHGCRSCRLLFLATKDEVTRRCGGKIASIYIVAREGLATGSLRVVEFKKKLMSSYPCCLGCSEVDKYCTWCPKSTKPLLCETICKIQLGHQLKGKSPSRRQEHITH